MFDFTMVFKLWTKLNNTIDMWDRAFWNSFQMAQITKWLDAIWDYMKKVKSSISMPHPPMLTIHIHLAHSQKAEDVKAWQFL